MFEHSDSAYYFIFSGKKMLITQAKQNPIPKLTQVKSLELDLSSAYPIGQLAGKNCYALSCTDVDLELKLKLNNALQLLSLRRCFDQFDEPALKMAMRAKQISYWINNHRYCGHCGHATEIKTQECVCLCPQCGLGGYPRISPCVIVLITRGDEVLLARSPHFKNGIYSLLAGFIEAGESAEEAIHREIMEEVQIKVHSLRYQYSQSWSFPHSLMLGYTAEYESGEICVDGIEIEEAGWFNKNNLPPKPSQLSIARKILDDYLMDQP